jgi:hypothetical protein
MKTRLALTKKIRVVAHDCIVIDRVLRAVVRQEGDIQTSSCLVSILNDVAAHLGDWLSKYVEEEYPEVPSGKLLLEVENGRVSLFVSENHVPHYLPEDL